MITLYEIIKTGFNKFDIYLDNKDLVNNTAHIAMVDNAKFYVYETMEEVYSNDIDELKEFGYITYKDDSSTSTIITINGSSVVTAAAAAFTRDMISQKIVIDGEAYRIKSYTSDTVIGIEPAYIGTGAAGVLYTVYFDTYNFPPDFRKFVVGKNITPITSFYNYDTFMLSDGSTASPIKIILIGRTTSSYYDTGTVAITKGATAVTGASTVWDSTMVGRSIQLGTYSRLYGITAVGSTTSITIDKGFGGTTIAAAALAGHKIDPPGIQQGRMLTSPSAVSVVPFEYYPLAIRLQDNEDIAPIALDSVLVSGLIAKWSKHEDHPLQTKYLQDYERIKNSLAVRKSHSEQKTWKVRYN